jgi:hypothetical protein
MAEKEPTTRQTSQQQPVKMTIICKAEKDARTKWTTLEFIRHRRPTRRPTLRYDHPESSAVMRTRPTPGSPDQQSRARHGVCG